MSQAFCLPCSDNAVSHQSIVETPAATLLLRDFCTAPFVESLKPDVGLRAFARLPEREHQLLRKIAERPDSILTLAYTQQGVIVGQVTLVPADHSWQGLTNTYEIAFEVSAGWRRSGLGNRSASPISARSRRSSSRRGVSRLTGTCPRPTRAVGVRAVRAACLRPDAPRSGA